MKSNHRANEMFTARDLNDAFSILIRKENTSELWVIASRYLRNVYAVCQ